ncbi:hypothetical protein RF11_14717 [Thelohanellus kitauei]|uniref:Uncharacterized protein n=1 Tax=Thelohanellus kitauei TaxID=669202 RepID=A0A0C2MJL4_THEKT|nr:hypothetical protein RF11_14717 [Thelohanellus kitauei]
MDVGIKAESSRNAEYLFESTSEGSISNVRQLIETNIFLKNCYQAIYSDIQRSKKNKCTKVQQMHEYIRKTQCQEISSDLKNCIRDGFRGFARLYFEKKYFITK